MPIQTVNRGGVGVEGTFRALYDRIAKLERKVAALSAPTMSNVAIVATANLPDLDTYDGNIFISDDATPTLCYVDGGITYALTGTQQ